MKFKEVKEIIKRIEDYPRKDESYVLGKTDTGYFFAWGSTFPREQEINGRVKCIVPAGNIDIADDGVTHYWHQEQAEDALIDAFDAWESLSSAIYTATIERNEGGGRLEVVVQKELTEELQIVYQLAIYEDGELIEVAHEEATEIDAIEAVRIKWGDPVWNLQEGR